ncbi:hypothetical protein ACFQY0_08770 [Haloferula chungangensis]|uniref:Yip1 domain-containing protein n=1 Tax=Haloferula chungangensis TaxID=1048331 RepID=A0ABW2L852_9BACT
MQGLPQPPALVPQYSQQAQDAEHIKLLVIFHYVMAGLTALGGCFPLIYLAMGMFFVSGSILMPPPSAGSGPTPPDMAFIGWMFIGFGALFSLLIWTCAVLFFMAGKRLSERRSWTFVFVVACILCLAAPLGTALGIFTIIVLQRPSVRALFGGMERQGISLYSNT